MIRPYLDEIREKAIELRRQGLQYRKIMERLKEEFKVDIAEITLKLWFLKAGLVKKYRSLEERLELATIVKELHQQGLGHRKIQKRLIELGYGRVSLTWISFMLRELHTSDGKVKKIRTDGYEFGYIVGALLSDGSIILHGYICGLTTKDIEFKNKLIRCAEAIGLRVHYFYIKESKLWEITIYSKILYDLITSGKWVL